MFQDEASEAEGFPSCWRQEKSTVAASAQTSEVITYDAEAQTMEKETVAVQTDEEPEKPFKLVVDNSKELREFLLRVEPMVSAALERNLESHAFDGYEVHWEERTTAVSCLHTLTEESLNYEFQCTGLAWNCSGSVLAVSYGRYDHQDWCSHKSLLCTWNLDRRGLDCSRADTSIDVSSCLMCVAFHPNLPALIAGGTFNGEVCVWNVGAESEPLQSSSGFTELGHKEPISKVSWTQDGNSSSGSGRKNRFHLLSLGTDGKVLLWEHSSERRQLRLVKGFRLLAESIPRSVRISKARGEAVIGGTCLSFSHEDKNLFVVGSENGSVLKCSLLAHTVASVDENTAEAAFRSPITFAFQPHQGPVYCTACSPFHRNLFLTCGTDATARIYSLLDTSPILLMEPGVGYLFSVCWSPSRPLVFAVGTGDGHVLIYDLKSSHIKPSVSLEASLEGPIYTTEFNSKRHQLLASGDASGVVKVWRLSTELVTQVGNEKDQLHTLAQETMSTATL